MTNAYDRENPFTRRPMFGTFQQAQLRIEVNATAGAIGDCLLRPRKLRQWLFPQRFETGLPERLHSGLTFTSWIGPVTLQHHVEVADSNCARLLLSKGIDGYHEWYWGDGWVQSRLEGISVIPLNLGHTMNLLRLQEFVTAQEPVER